MADPVTWAVIAAGSQVASTVMSGLGAARRSEYDAQVARSNARMRVMQGNEQAMAVRRQAVVDFSRQRAMAASRGIQFSGTALDLAAQNAAQAELEARQIMYASVTQSEALRDQANEMRRTGRTQLISTAVMAGGQVASGMRNVQLASQNQQLMTTGGTYSG